MNKILATLGLVGLLVLTGCSTTSQNQTTWLTPVRVEKLTKLGTYVAVSAYLNENPADKATFVSVKASLQILVDQSKWDSVTVAAILQNLPVKELQTTEAKLAFQGGLLLVDLLGYGSFDAKNVEHVKAFIIGFNDGLDLALSFTANNKVAARALTPDNTVYWKLQTEEKQTRPYCKKCLKKW